MNDYLVKGISHNKQVRAYAAITTETIEEARRAMICYRLLLLYWDVL